MTRVTLASMLRRVYGFTLVAGFLCVYTSSGVAEDQRAIPDDNLAYPVLITVNEKSGALRSTGSGFYVYNDKFVYLVTAKHVLFDEQTHQLPVCGEDQKAQKKIYCGIELRSYSKDPQDAQSNLYALDMEALQDDGNIRPHPTQDVAVIRLFTVTKPPVSPLPSGSTQGPTSPGSLQSLPGVTTESMAQQGLLAVPPEGIKPFSQVLVGNDVIVFGYPTSLALQDIPQLDLHHPLLRKGIVAGSNPITKSIFLDCPVYFGNSGGPVLELDKDKNNVLQTNLRIIGVVTTYIPFIDTALSRTVAIKVEGNSGYSMATPMDFVLELLK
jgi:hypothetical protein